MKYLLDDNPMVRLKQFLDYYETARNFMNPYIDRAETFYKNLRFYQDKSELPYANVFCTRDTFARWEDACARTHQRLFSTRPYGTYIPRLGGSENISEMLKLAVGYYLEHDYTRTEQHYMNLIQNGNGYGTGHLTVMPEWGPYWGESRFKDFEGISLTAEDYWDVLVLPDTRELSHRTFAIFRKFWIDKEVFDGYVEAGIWKDDDGEVTNDGHDRYTDEKIQVLQDADVYSWWEPKRDQVFIIQMFFGSGHEIVVANMGTEIRNTWLSDPKKPPHPGGIPMIKYDYCLFPNEYLGVGIPELMADQQKLKNVLISQRVETVEYANQPIMKYRMGIGLPTELYDFLPGLHWPVTNMDDVMPMQMPQPPQAAFLEVKEQDQMMDDAIGSTRYGRGEEPQHGREAARTVYWLQSAGAARPEMRARMADIEGFRRLLFLVPLYLHQYCPKKTLKDVVGVKHHAAVDEFYKLKLDDVRRQYYAEPVSSSITNIKQVRQEQAMQKLQMALATHPAIMQNPIQPFIWNYHELYKKALEEFEEIEPEKLLLRLNPPHAQPQPGQAMGPPSQMLAEAGLSGKIQPQPAPSPGPVVEQQGAY